MKKIILLAVAILVTALLVGEFKTGRVLPSTLRDGENMPIQVGRYIQMEDDENTESPVTLATSIDSTLYVPDYAAEITINPNGGTLKWEDFSDSTMYFQFDIEKTFPCSGVDSLKISNDSGSSVTWSFYFNML